MHIIEERKREWKIGYSFPLILSSSLIGQARNWGVRTSWAKISSAAAAGPDVLGWARVATKYTHTHTHMLPPIRQGEPQHKASQVNGNSILSPSSLLLKLRHSNIFNANVHHTQDKHTHTHTHTHRLYWTHRVPHINLNSIYMHRDQEGISWLQRRSKVYSRYQALSLLSYPECLAINCCVRCPIISDKHLSNYLYVGEFWPKVPGTFNSMDFSLRN